MAKLKGISKLSKTIDSLKDVAEEIRESLNEKREWFEGKSESWQESDKGQEWDEHLSDVENLLDEIDTLEMIEYE